MNAGKTIYEYIKESVVDGELPADFSISDYDDDDSKIRMADGAMDGICVYHMRPSTPDDIVPTIAHALETACTGDYASANETLSGLLKQHRAIGVIDQVQQAVLDVAPMIDDQELFAYATFHVFTSTDKEMVKLGLSILEVFNEPDEQMKEVVRTLGLSDEFAIFCAWNARTWANGNDEVFAIARHADGWGRIHAIEMLEPETDEIREWLLYEGVNNAVMPEYSALTCYVKADVANRLERELEHEEFSAITAIVYAALSDEPVAGISSLEDPKAELARYVRQASRQTLDLPDCECLDAVAEYAENAGWDDLFDECEALLRTDEVRNLVADEVIKGRGLGLACQLGISYKDALLEAMRKDFDGMYFQCRWLMDDPEHLEALLELFREKVPLDSIEDDPRDEIGLGKEFDTYNKLDMLIQSLRHRMPAGFDYLMRTLTSPTVRNRTLSHRVLRCWVNDEGKPLAEVSPEAYERLRYAYEREPREDLRETMLPLLEGETEFSQDML